MVALELMRQRAMHDTERRLAGDVLAEALTGRLAERELASRLRPFGIGDRAAVLVFAVDDPVAEAGDLDRFLHDGGHGALVAPRENVLCAVVDAGDEGLEPIELAREARAVLGGSGGPPRAAASRAEAAGALRRSFNEARIALEATAIANGDAPDVASFRDMGASQLLLNLQDDEALALYCQSVLGPAGGRRRRVRRGADPLAGGVHRAERPVGEGRPPAVLPSPHAALPDPPRRGADRARPGQRPRPDRVLARTTRKRVGAMRVAVLGSRGHHRPRDRPRPRGVRGGRRTSSCWTSTRRARVPPARRTRPTPRSSGSIPTVAWATCWPASTSWSTRPATG